jgi:hypothetical protein
LKRALVAFAAALVLSACEEPPLREIDAAGAALERAREGGAELFAPERFREAAVALDIARARLKDRDYRAALSAAADAGEKSRTALEAAEAGKALARSSAESALAEVGVLLEDCAAARREALRSRVPERALAAVDAEVESSRAAAALAAEALRRGAIADALRTASDLQAAAASLPGRYRAAAEEQGRARPRRPSRAR